MSRPKDMRFPELDSLRGFAVLQVLVLHLWQISWYSPPWLDGLVSFQGLAHIGYLGVHLFLMLSGMCLFLPVLRQPGLLDDSRWIKPYFIRRLGKIMPSYLLILFVMGLSNPHQFPASEWPRQLLSHLTFTHSFWRDTYSTFAGVLWSLAPEFQFYLLFPLIAPLMIRHPYVTAACLTAVGIGYRYWVGVTSGGTFMIGQLPGFLDIYALGMLSARVMVRPPKWLTSPEVGLVATVISLCFCGVAIRLSMPYHSSTILPPHGALLYCLPFAVLTVVSTRAPDWFRKISAPSVMRFLGFISFNLYLWHQVIGFYMKKYGWPAALTSIPNQDLAWRQAQFYLSTTISVAWAVVLTYCLEKPILDRVAAWTARSKPVRSGRRIYRLPRRAPSRSPARKPSVRRRARG